MATRPVPSNAKVENWLFRNGYRYWCFLSYARGGQEEEFVKHLKRRLPVHIGDRFTKKRDAVFLDQHTINPGAMWQKTLAQAICSSVLHVPVFGETYFSENKHWCRREFQQMVDLARQRARAGNSDRTSVFPIIFRAPGSIPKIVSSEFQAHDFKANSLKEYHRLKPFRHLLDQLAESIKEAACELHSARRKAKCAGAVLPNPFPIPGAKPRTPLP